MNERVGVGMVGVGMWGRRVAAGVKRTSGLELVSCFARSEETRRAAAAELRCHSASSLDELLDDRRIEGVLVLTPNQDHRSVTLRAAAAGKHVMVEKPMADTIEAAREMAEACAEKEVTLFVAHCFRRLGAARATAELIRAGRIGNAVMAEASFSLPGAFKPGSWRASRDTLAGGPLTQLGVHHADTLMSWFGPVAAVTGNLAHLAAKAEVDDVGVALLEHRSGVRSIISCSYVSPKTYELRVYGTLARLTYHTEMGIWPEAERMDSATTLTVEQLDGRREAIDFSERDMIVDELEEFARCVRTGAPPETGAAEGIASLEVIEAAIASSRTGRRQRVGGFDRIEAEELH